MHRLLLVGALSAALAGCSGGRSVSATAVSTQLADGVEFVVLKLPAMV